MTVVKGGYRRERHIPGVVGALVSSVEIEVESRRICYSQSPGRVLESWYIGLWSGGDLSWWIGSFGDKKRAMPTGYEYVAKRWRGLVASRSGGGRSEGREAARRCCSYPRSIGKCYSAMVRLELERERSSRCAGAN